MGNTFILITYCQIGYLVHHHLYVWVVMGNGGRDRRKAAQRKTQEAVG